MGSAPSKFGCQTVHTYQDAKIAPISNGRYWLAVDVGEVLLIDDVVTGFDDNKPGRPCMVVRVVGMPRAGAWVVPRSTKGRQGTFVSAGTLPGLDKDGRFMFLPHFVAQVDLNGCPSLGVLEWRDRERVLENVNDVEIDL